MDAETASQHNQNNDSRRYAEAYSHFEAKLGVKKLLAEDDGLGILLIGHCAVAGLLRAPGVVVGGILLLPALSVLADGFEWVPGAMDEGEVGAGGVGVGNLDCPKS